MKEVSVNTKISWNEYARIHQLIVRRYGNAPECVFCSRPSKRFEWANVTDNYTVDLEDYLPMCLACHRRHDMTPETIERRRLAANRRIQSGFKFGELRPVVRIGTEGEMEHFRSTQHASRSTGIDFYKIRYRLTRGTRDSNGNLWKYEEFESNIKAGSTPCNKKSFIDTGSSTPSPASKEAS